MLGKRRQQRIQANSNQRQRITVGREFHPAPKKTIQFFFRLARFKNVVNHFSYFLKYLLTKRMFARLM